jgi:DNA-binding NarL/FixJ family response regulator
MKIDFCMKSTYSDVTTRRGKLLIVDDHDLIRAGVKEILTNCPGLDLIEEIDSGKEAIKLISNLMPEIVLMDINMPAMDGIAATNIIKKKYPDIKVLGFSISNEIYRVRKMIEAGACGFVKKDISSNDLISAINTIRKKNCFFCLDTLNKLSGQFFSNTNLANSEAHNFSFTQKELIIIQMICEELSSREIGIKLFQSERTIEGYREKIMKKMGVKNTISLIKLAIKMGVYELKQ